LGTEPTTFKKAVKRGRRGVNGKSLLETRGDFVIIIQTQEKLVLHRESGANLGELWRGGGKHFHHSSSRGANCWRNSLGKGGPWKGDVSEREKGTTSGFRSYQ